MKRIPVIFICILTVLIAHGAGFDSNKAFDYLIEQVNMGPRYPGSEGHAICRDWLIEKSKAYADTVIVQEFTAYRPDKGQDVTAWNIIARFSPENKQRVMLSAHWDTRPISDMDLLNYNTPVPGANDGASGTAVLIELMKTIKTLGLKEGVDIIFWDAEDMGIARSGKYFCQGSEFYSKNIILPKPRKGILIDMIGDADLVLPVEANSMAYAPDLVNEVWGIAARLGYGHVFQKLIGMEIFDDHAPLNTIAGIPTIDIIDFDYRYKGRNIWHTPRDLPAHCSPQSLHYVGHVLLEWLLSQ